MPSKDFLHITWLRHMVATTLRADWPLIPFIPRSSLFLNFGQQMDPDMTPTYYITVVTHMALVNGHWQVTGLGFFFINSFGINTLSKSINSFFKNHTVLQNLEVFVTFIMCQSRMVKNHQSLDNRFIQAPDREGRKEGVIYRAWLLRNSGAKGIIKIGRVAGWLPLLMERMEKCRSPFCMQLTCKEAAISLPCSCMTVSCVTSWASVSF